MTKTDFPAIPEGSKRLKNNLHERYARLRAAAQPRIVAFRKAGYIAKNDHVADANSFRLERKRGVRERIEFMTHQVEERIAEKRAAIEEMLWAVHEADLADYFETYNAIERDDTGQPALSTETRVRPKLLTELPPELAALIEDVTIDAKGRAIPKLYSKMQASKELRSMLNIGKPVEAADISRLSDAELVAQLKAQAQELGIEIDLNYRFLQRPADDKGQQVLPIARPRAAEPRGREDRSAQSPPMPPSAK
jgi:hypothetical protein